MGWWRSRGWWRLAGEPASRPSRRRGRWVAPLILLAVLGLGLSAAEAAAAEGAASRARAAILFLPWSEAAGGDRELLARLDARRELALGLVSPTAGGYSPEQALLDMSQGTRVPLAQYGRPAPRLRLDVGPEGSGRIAGWGAAVARAGDVPGDLVPGLLAAQLTGAGGEVAFAGVFGLRNAEAVVAADRSGHVTRVTLGEPSRLGARLAREWRRASLLVAALPPAGAGLRAVDRLLAARGAGDLVIVVRAPPRGLGRPPLLAAAMAGRGLRPRAALSSATTRRPGIVAATDLAPTVLRSLGRPVPHAMQGRPARGRAGPAGAAEIGALRERLSTVLWRRAVALTAALAAWSAVLIGLTAVGGRKGARAASRLGLLMALWLPVTALATAARAPASPLTEGLLIAVGSLGLATATDRVLRWPSGPAAPATATLVAYAADFAAGSPLTATAVAGPNPAGGARFFGAGNELETLLGLSTLLGVGAGLAAAHAGRRASAAGFLLVGIVAAAVLGASALGADVGAVVTLAAGAATAAWWSLSRSRSARRLVVVALVTAVIALAALVGLEATFGGSAHLGRSVLGAQDAGSVVDVAERRLAAQIAFLTTPGTLLIVIACLAALGAGLALRRRLLAPVLAAGAAPVAAAMVGSLAAVLAGAVFNDSAPDMLAIGTVLLALAALYAWARPAATPGAEDRPRCPVAASPAASTMPLCG